MTPQKPLALIIEDDAQQLFIFSEALRQADFYIEMIEDGSMALTRLAETVPDIVILDLHLPRVSGKKILGHIRADERLIATRVILATADPATADMLHHDVDLVLIKPISFIQLRDLAMRLCLPTPVELD